ncbi:MAG: serine/threonine protein kinase [Bdellovibrionales bacterium]|nr:serine/threonine protein kinase [Bdellovibrionales bacterium]
MSYPEPGSEILLADRYRLERRIGEGSYGQVFEATDTHVGSRVAIKIIRPEKLIEERDRIRLEREIKHCSQIESDYVAKLLSLISSSESIVLVLELVQGKSLYAYLSSGVQFSVKEATNFGRQIAHGLLAIHQAGVIHRDLKLENISLREDGLIKILDFGSSIVAESVRTSASRSGIHTLPEIARLRATQDAQAVGTLQYLCPHYLHTGKFDQRVDIYALGIVLYEIITGYYPFTFKDAQELIIAKYRGEFDPPSTKRTDCTPALDQLITRCLQTDPDLRPQNVHEVEAILSQELRALPNRERTRRSRTTDLGRAKAEIPKANWPLIDWIVKAPLGLLRWLRRAFSPVEQASSYVGTSVDATLGSSIVKAIVVVGFMSFLVSLLALGQGQNPYLTQFWKYLKYKYERVERTLSKDRYITPTIDEEKGEILRNN